MKLNYGNDYYYQEDNSRVHKSKKVQTFMQNSGVKVMKWKMIFIQVYNGLQFNYKQSLKEKVIATINDINMKSRGAIVYLYNMYGSRLVAVLKTNGDVFNK